MSEIKFRGWDKKEKHMCEEIVYIDFKAEMVGLHQLGYGTYALNFNQVILMQYTGLKDINGKKIYKGDIFHLGDKNIKYMVIYVDCGFKGKQLKSNSYIGLTYWQEKIEVIGNIYENSEIMEG